MRKKGNIPKKPVLFIACEGTSTEFNYFTSWAETDIALETFQRVDVYPDENEDRPKTTPYQLYEIAKEVLDTGIADFAWIVFDKDNHPRLPATFAGAAAANIKIAFSSRSFEEWVLLHFQKNSTPFNATGCDNAPYCGTAGTPNCTPTNCLTGHIRRQNFIPAYSKQTTFDLFGEINGNTDIALVNTAWLRAQVGASVNVAQPALHLLNPYTDVDQLIHQLTQNELLIEWGNANTNVTLSRWIVNAELNNAEILVRVSHNQPNAQLLNGAFTSGLMTTDDVLNETACTVIGSQYLANNNGSDAQILRTGDTIEYRLQTNNQPYFLFKNDNVRVYITL